MICSYYVFLKLLCRFCNLDYVIALIFNGSFINRFLRGICMGKCHSCSKKGEVELKYLGKWLCELCFCDLIRRRISRTMRKNKLVEEGDKVLVAISGGKDSALVLKYLADYAKHGDIEVFAMYVDRGDNYSINSLKHAQQQDTSGVASPPRIPSGWRLSCGSSRGRSRPG